MEAANHSQQQQHHMGFEPFGDLLSDLKALASRESDRPSGSPSESESFIAEGGKKDDSLDSPKPWGGDHSSQALSPATTPAAGGGAPPVPICDPAGESRSTPTESAPMIAPAAMPPRASARRAVLPTVTPAQLQARVDAHRAAGQHNVAQDVAGVSCPSGFEFAIYDGDFAKHYAIPSENVQITRGAIKYVDHHTRYGAQTRFRFQLCHNHLKGKCPKQFECSYIHATQLPAPTQVHLNPFAPRRLAADRHGRSNEVAPSLQDDPSVTKAYERLRPGYTLQIYPPQGNQISSEVTVVRSEQLFRTRGAEEAVRKLLAAADPSPDGTQQRPHPARHCTKFQYRRACPLGPECPDVHSTVPFAGTALEVLPPRPAAAAAASSPLVSRAPPVPAFLPPTSQSQQPPAAVASAPPSYQQQMMAYPAAQQAAPPGLSPAQLLSLYGGNPAAAFFFSSLAAAPGAYQQPTGMAPPSTAAWLGGPLPPPAYYGGASHGMLPASMMRQM